MGYLSHARSLDFSRSSNRFLNFTSQNEISARSGILSPVLLRISRRMRDYHKNFKFTAWPSTEHNDLETVVGVAACMPGGVCPPAGVALDER